MTKLLGKVVGRFVCDRIDEQIVFHRGITRIMVKNYIEDLATLCRASALSIDEIHDYIDKDGKDLKIVYGWHISDLKIYDNPKEIREFKTPPCEKPDTYCCKCKYFEVHNTPNFYETDCWGEDGVEITRPPQSWCYVESL